jgi:hypothetical protein
MSRTHEKARRRAKRRKLAERRRPQVAAVHETAAEAAFESEPPLDARDYCGCERCTFDRAFENLRAAEAQAQAEAARAREAREAERAQILDPPPPSWPASWWRRGDPLNDAEVLDERRRLQNELALTDLEIRRLEAAIERARARA